MTTNAPSHEINNVGTVSTTVHDASPSEDSPSASKQHKRTYQACEPCRNRKVRCDLGSVDAPSDPPCLRCRREKKQCYFTETRRKRKAGEPGAPELRDFGGDMSRNDHFSNGHPNRSDHLENMGVYPKSPGLQQITRDGSLPGVEVRVKGDGDEVRNDSAAALFQQPIHHPGDALRLLVDAASRTETVVSRRHGPDRPLKQEGDGHIGNIDPAIMKISTSGSVQVEDPRQLALQTWARLRYVRANWFTPLEGMAYLEYFSENLSHLTPTLIPDFSKPETHVKLLTEEPMLTVTILTISSRYMKLAGAAGASRSIYIHSMLWQECQNMITRMFWGQEHFGGSFGLASGFRADTGEPVKRGLRGLGTVEALLLLSDWHPRSMHFPPAAGNDDILAPLQTEWEEANLVMQSRNPHQGWTEPAMRSDRMSWSLVGAAYNLAVELGVFDSMPEKGFFEPGHKTRAYDSVRADKIGRLVHIYVSQTSGRLGYPNMLPYQETDMDHKFFKMVLDPSEKDKHDPDFKAEQMQRAMCELTSITRCVNSEIFRSKQLTLDLIQTNEYTKVLDSFWPRLREWLEHTKAAELTGLAYTIVMMEYEYSRTYINSLALQAQIEQYAALTNNDPAAISSDTALFSAKLVEISKQNQPYIAEVINATRNMLRHVVEGLVPTGGLKHSPVRTIFRILSGAMFLLKTFALGSKENDIQSSMSLLRSTVVALRTTVVDDCHLSVRIADLLESLIKSISTRFVRVPISGKSSNSKRHRQSLSTQPGIISNGDNKMEHPVLRRQSTNHDSQQSPDSAKLADIPPLVNPHESNMMIMPPPDYVYNNMQDNPYSHHTSPHGSAPSPIQNGFSAGPLGPQPSTQGTAAQGMQSPVMGNNGSVRFSPTQQNQQPFSPVSNGSDGGTGSYNWYAMNINPLLHSSNAGGPQTNGMATSGIAWGNMFGPEIGDTLEMFSQLAPDGNNFDESLMGTWAA